MASFVLRVFDNEGKNTGLGLFRDFRSCKEYAEGEVLGAVFKIIETKPCLWVKGDYLHGLRKFSGGIDWIRIPLHKEASELC